MLEWMGGQSVGVEKEGRRNRRRNQSGQEAEIEAGTVEGVGKEDRRGRPDLSQGWAESVDAGEKVGKRCQEQEALKAHTDPHTDTCRDKHHTAAWTPADITRTQPYQHMQTHTQKPGPASLPSFLPWLFLQAPC